jgi:hypothetical protein
MGRGVRLICLMGLLAGCNDSSGPLEDGQFRITNVFPADGGTALPAGAIAVQFSHHANPRTLGGAFTVKTGTDILPVAVTYQSSTRTTLLSAPMLPGTAYQVELDSSVLSSSGQPLEAGMGWSFTTTSWAGRIIDQLNFFGEATRGTPALGISPDGQRHLFYSSLGDNRYATCLLPCASPGAWQVAGVETGAAGYPSLGIRQDGSLHLLTTQYIYGNTEQFLWYGRCVTSCADSASWTAIPLDRAGEARTPSLQVGSNGALHAAMYRVPEGDLLYGVCPADCTVEANWTFTTVESAGNVGLEPSLAVEPGGKLHIASIDFGNRALRYATCSRSCTIGSNWVTTTVHAESKAGRTPSLRIGPVGEVHIAYYDEAGRDLAYSLCRSACTRAGNWLATVVDGTGDTGREPSLAVDPQGRLHLAYYHFDAGALRYGTCSRSCEEPGSWRLLELDGEGDVGRSPVIALADDKITIAYLDYTTGPAYALKILD